MNEPANQPMSSPSATDRATSVRAERRALALLAVVLLVHAVMVTRLFPGLGSLTDPKSPVIVVDHAIHLYHGALGSRFVREHGTSWGFDPFFMAGYPETPVWDSSSNLSIWFQALAGGGYQPAAYKLGLWVCLFLVVAAVPAGCWAAGMGRWETTVATLLAWLYFWVGFPIMLERSGLFAFNLASGGLVLLLGLALRFEAAPTVRRWAALTGCGGALFFAHVTTPILALGAVAGLSVTNLRRHGRRWWAALVLAPVLATLANLFWLVPLWRFRGIRNPSYLFMNVDTAWLLRDHYTDITPDSVVGLGLLVLGSAGLLVWWKGGARVRAATFGGTALVLLLLFGFGSLHSTTAMLEPLRFRIPLNLVLTVPAASALCAVAGGVARGLGGGWRGALVTAVAGLLALVALGRALPRTAYLTGFLLTQHRPLVVGLRPEMRALVRMIQTQTEPSARILFEDQLRLLETTDPECTHWTPLLPYLLEPKQRQFIGGLYQVGFIAHSHHASFGDFHLGGVPIDRWSEAEIRQYFDQYNIGWAICWSPLSRFYFDRLPQATRVAVVPRWHTPPRGPVSPHPQQWQAMMSRGGPLLAMKYSSEADSQYVIYRIDRKHSFFLQGQGQLSAVDANRIEFSNVVPERGEVLLSLHSLDTWRTEPPLPLSPSPVQEDPIPFVRIKLTQPLERLVLFNSYRRP